MSSTANISNEADARTQLAALGNMVDYAIVEGAQKKLPVFVFLLRLARLALLEASADPACLDAAEGSRIWRELGFSRTARQSKRHKAPSRAVDGGPK